MLTSLPYPIVRQTNNTTDTAGIDKHEAIMLVINVAGAASRDTDRLHRLSRGYGLRQFIRTLSWDSSLVGPYCYV